MDEPKTIQAAFRLPPETIEWLDRYAAFLSEEGGYTLSRAQALLRVISLAKPKEEKRMATFYYFKKLKDDGGFSDIGEAKAFFNGAKNLAKARRTQNKINESNKYDLQDFIDLAIKDEALRKSAIQIGTNTEAYLESMILETQSELLEAQKSETDTRLISYLEHRLMVHKAELYYLQSTRGHIE